MQDIFIQEKQNGIPMPTQNIFTDEFFYASTLPHLSFFFFITGLCIGSFLNVVIARLPQEKSIVHPPSACPVCDYRLRWYDNIPLISYLILRAKCRQCKTRISLRYPVVELLTGFFAFLCYYRFNLTMQALVYFVFICFLLVITYIDLDHFIIPDILSLPAIPIFFLASFLLPDFTWKDSLFGILAGGGGLFLLAWIYYLITGNDGMGGGDIKLLGGIGAALGLTGALFTVFVSALLGTVIGLAIMVAQKESGKLKIPFGPFLSIGAICYIFFGPQILWWYFSMMR